MTLLLSKVKGKHQGQILWLLSSFLLSFPLVYLFQQAIWGSSFSSLFKKQIFVLFVNSLVVTTAVAILSVGLGFILAFLIVKTDLPYKRFWKVAFVLPLSIPTYLGAIVYTSLLAPRGTVNQWLGADLWNIYGLDGVIFVLTLFTFPYSFLICSSQLQNMGRTWEEVSFDLGRGRMKTILLVVMGLCRPALLSSALLVSLYVLGDFGAIALLRFNTFTTAIFYQLDSFHSQNAALLGLVLLIPVVIIVSFRDSFFKRKDHQSVVGKNDSLFLYSLGSYKVWALLFLGIIFCLSVLVPLVTLLFYVFQGEGGLGQLNSTFVWKPLRTSFVIAFAVAFSTVGVGFFLSYAMKVGGDGWGRQFFKKIVFSLYGLPGILIALGTLFVARNLFGNFYGTFWPLLVALFILLMPQALEALGGVRKTLGKNLIHASFDLGRGHWGTLKGVFFPLVRNGLVGTFVLIFVSTLKELPVQLILRPPGMTTLSVQLWIDASEAFYGQAGLSGIMIVLLASLSTPFLLLLTGREGVREGR